MPSRDAAIAVLDQLQEAQANLYIEGDPGPLRDLLTDDIAWHVPGTSPIAGTYRGPDDVIAYMQTRRDLARGTFRMYRRDVLTGDDDTVAALTDGEAIIDGVPRTWSTVGVYRLRDGRVVECWLLPFDQAEFDDIWTPGNG
jgi:ketosteroid isomerase-like protein